MAVPTDEVEAAKETLAKLLNPNDGAYFLALNNLASSLMSRFALSRNPHDLDEGITRTKQVLDLAPPSHHFHAQALCNMGQVLSMRFKFAGDSSDLTQAIRYFEATVDSCTPEHSLYPQFVGNLASGLLNRYWIWGDVIDLDRIIEIGSSALSASPGQGRNQDSLLNNLAIALKERFTKQGNKNDLDSALSYYQSCLDLRPPGHPLRHSVLGNLASAMLLRFEMDGDMQDLESAGSYYVSALRLRPPGAEGYLLYLTSLGMVHWHLFNVEGKIERLETAIGCYQTAMEYSKIPNMDHSRLLDNYSAALQSRYTLLGNIDDLDQAIQYLTTSADILPLTYFGRPITLLNCGTALLTRFQVKGNIADLDSSIEDLASSLQLCTPGHHERPSILSVYGRALHARFNTRGDIQDLNLAASMCKDALTNLSSKELSYPPTVVNLTTTLLDCFKRLGNIEECQTVIDHCDRALVYTRPGEPSFIPLKINRSKAFLQKFQYGQEEKDIETCIDTFLEIIPTIPEGHTLYANGHLQFGMALESRFMLSMDQKDLAESIAHYRISHRNCKRGNPLYASICMQLGNALRQRFEHHLDADAVDEGIVLLAEVEDILSPTPGQFDYKSSLLNLGATLFMRFQALRNRDDLDTAIERISHALTLPTLAEEYLFTFSLATFLLVRFAEDEDMKDLERCVEFFAVAAEQMPPKHLVRGTLCRNYGHALVKLAYHRDHIQNHNAAVVLFKEAIEHLPASHSDQLQTHLHLADVLHLQALLTRDVGKLYDAVKLLRWMFETLPADNPTLQAAYYNAAKISMTIYKLSQQQTSFMEDSFQYYEKAARYAYAHSFTMVSTALEWAEHAEELEHSSALRAYQTALGSLYQHLLTTPSIKSRHVVLLDKRWVRRTGTLATDAAACAIARGELAMAVELSEQGRGLLWSQLSYSRTPLDALWSTSDTGRVLASDFERVRGQLAQCVVAPDESHMAVTTSRLTTEEASRRYRQLSKELEDIVARVRQEEGFQSFLDRPAFESLRCAAVGGPVILVNVSRRRCDAVIVLHDALPRLVTLPDTSLEELTTLSARFYKMLQTTSRVGEEKMREREVVVVLRTLWDTIVRPIVDELAPLVPRGARIWWCPTSKLTTLPLHAAGPYRKGALNLPNIYVSSYTPTLAALIRARHRPPLSTSPPHAPPGFIAIGQAKPASSTGPALQTVSTELALVQSLLPSPPSTYTFSALDEEASTADAVLGALATHGWAHLACHGYPDVESPFDAAFALNDRGVTVLDVVRARGTREAHEPEEDAPAPAPAHAQADATPGEFAFLSACHTAVGDPHAPDEIIHLAAAMQFSGFRSVVGTMWAVDDGMARYMVKAFYECMFPGGGEVQDLDLDLWDCTRAARALNRAAKLVDKALVSLDQRIVFIHIGA